MIAEVYHYQIMCDNCETVKRILSIYKKENHLFADRLREDEDWLYICRRDNDWSTFKWHEKVFCRNKECQSAAMDFLETIQEK